jgi:hypothetical protein
LCYNLIHAKNINDISEMIKVEFKNEVNGLNEVICERISSDPMNEDYFLIVFNIDELWEVPIKNVKHISQH